MHLDGPSVFLHNILHKGQSQPCPSNGPRPRLVNPVKGFKNTLTLFFWDSDTCILYFYDDFLTHFTALLCCQLEQIVHQTDHPLRVGPDN